MKLKHWKINEGDVLKRLRKLPENHFDASISDPPYGLDFMGKAWDKGVPSAAVYAELLRVLKPGASILHFGGSRTHHRLMCSIEDGGFELRDCLMWLYGSGFPKGLDISKAIDEKLDAPPVMGLDDDGEEVEVDELSSDEAKAFDDYRTGLKPAWEPVILAQKPIDGTFAENALEWGVAGINVGGCRVDCGDEKPRGSGNNLGYHGGGKGTGGNHTPDAGRWPSNVLVDEVAALRLNYATRAAKDRFFYSPKASKAEKNAGLKEVEAVQVNDGRKTSIDTPFQRGDTLRKNPHPTVKPIALIKYLATLLLPPERGGGTDSRRILIPYSGSGSEMIGSLLAGWDYAEGIEIDPEFIGIAERRLKHWIEAPGSLFEYAARAKK